MALTGLKPPGELILDKNATTNWTTWIRSFEYYCVASGVSSKAERVQCCLFLHVAGPEAQKVYANMDVDPSERDKIVPLTRQFKEYCMGKANITVTRYRFNNNNQRGETISAYINELKDQVKYCEYEHMEESLLRDRIINGVKSNKLRNKLLQTAELDLAKCINICELSEFDAQQLKEDAEPREEIEVDYVRQGRMRQEARGASAPTRGGTPPSWRYRPQGSQSTRRYDTPCNRCGTHHRRDDCPAKGKICGSCGKVGHYARLCRSRPITNTPLHEVRTTERDTAAEPIAETDTLDYELVIGVVHLTGPNDKMWYTNIKIAGHNTLFKLDTGSEANIIPRSIFDKIPNAQLRKPRYNLVTYSGERIQPEGETDLRLKGNPYRFQVVSEGSPILGRSACVEMQLIERNENIDEIVMDDVIIQKEDIPMGPGHIDEKMERNIATAERLVSEYRDVFTGLGLIKSNANIYIDSSVEPCIDPPRRIPYAIQNQVKQELDRMISLGVIVPQNEPTPWVNSITIVKKASKVRVCLDPTKLNKAIRRGPHQTKTIEEVIARTAGSKYFSVIDAKTGYWQIELNTPSSHLCTFNTPWGRYRYTRLPFGINAASDIFITEMNRILHGIKGVDVVTDDILIYGETMSDHNQSLRTVLQRARHCNLKLNPDKSKICKTEVKYVGHLLTAQGVKPDPERVQAIVDMPDPVDKKGVQRFLGMVGYVHKFIPNMSDIAKPLRTILGKDIAWHWQTEQVEAFNKLKSCLKSAPVLRYYDVKKPITVQVDACKTGLGAVLLQEGQPIAMASKALDNVQSGYAVIEKELLAICFGCVKFHNYIFGKKTIVQTDHKPLVAIMTKPLYTLSARMQRMRMRLQNYHIEVKYVKGTHLLFADTLSRAHSVKCTPHDLFNSDISVTAIDISSDLLSDIREETNRDETMLNLRKLILNGWPHKTQEIHPRLQQYHKHKDVLTIQEGLITKNNKIIIPDKLQNTILHHIHESHLGLTKSKQLARDNVFWPGIDTQLTDIINRCNVCQNNRKHLHREPLKSHEIPDLPYSKVGTDIFEINNKTFLITIDYFSKYPEITQLPNTRAATVIEALKNNFARHGIPNEVMSDNGPQFRSHEYADFAKSYNFKPLYSTPYYPQSNGQTERYVQTIKNMMKKCSADHVDIQIGLLNYRNTPLEHINLSPSQLLMGRRLRSRIPTTKTNLKPQLTPDISKQRQYIQKQQKLKYDRHAGKSHKQIIPGTTVKYRNYKQEWTPGTILHQTGPTGREYTILNNRQKRVTRNRINIIETPTSKHPETTMKTAGHETEHQNNTPDTVTTRYGRVIRSVDRFTLN